MPVFEMHRRWRYNSEINGRTARQRGPWARPSPQLNWTRPTPRYRLGFCLLRQATRARTRHSCSCHQRIELAKEAHGFTADWSEASDDDPSLLRQWLFSDYFHIRNLIKLGETLQTWLYWQSKPLSMWTQSSSRSGTNWSPSYFRIFVRKTMFASNIVF